MLQSKGFFIFGLIIGSICFGLWLYANLTKHKSISDDTDSINNIGLFGCWLLGLCLLTIIISLFIYFLSHVF